MEKGVSKSRTIEVRAGCGNIHVIFEENDGKTWIHARYGKNGSCRHGMIEMYSSFCNELFKRNATLGEIRDLMAAGKDGGCSEQVISGGVKIRSCADGISKAIDLYLKEEKKC